MCRQLRPFQPCAVACTLAPPLPDGQCSPLPPPPYSYGLQQSLPATLQPDGTARQKDEAAAEESSALEAEKEANKAQRMLSLAGIRVTSDAASSLTNSAAQQQQPPSSSSPPLLNLNGVSPTKRRSSRGRGGTASKGPPRFSILRFLATIEGEGVVAPAAATAANGEDVPTTATAGAGAEVGAISYGRGDLVEFTVVARRGQRQQSQRVENVSLLTKAALPCR